MERYTIVKILSNNVVLVSQNEQNYILVGKGIGFNKKKGTILEDVSNIEEKFISLNGLKENEYENFLNKVDPKIIEIVKDIIEMVKNELGEELNSNIHVGLIDHIDFAIQRLKKGIKIINPFLVETKMLYPKEYVLAQKAVDILEDRLKINIPDAEIGFLTLHIYGGRGQINKSEALANSKMMNAIVNYVQKKLNIIIDKSSFEYKRFFMHIKGVVDRITNKKTIKNVMLLKIKEEMMVEYKVAYDISKIIERTWNSSKIPESEIGYIALHLHRLKDSMEV
ncbi:PRD domain-containing protein [Clostridiaceae bacterium M8S5]|nr:PRD domain-containing protein [Clostridiaceae bacterium M8S5]